MNTDCVQQSQGHCVHCHHCLAGRSVEVRSQHHSDIVLSYCIPNTHAHTSHNLSHSYIYTAGPSLIHCIHPLLICLIIHTSTRQDLQSFGSAWYTMIRYANDKAVVCNTQKGLQELMNNLNRVTKEYGMKINARKTNKQRKDQYEHLYRCSTN